MGIDRDDIKKLNTELYFVVEGLLKGETVWEWTGKGKDNGWCITRRVFPSRSAYEYYVGDVPPADLEE